MAQQKESLYKNLPTVNVAETQPYWDGCKRHELLIQRCKKCSSFQFYPRGFCGECYSMDLDWVKSSGRGTVWSFTVTKRNRDPLFAHMVPYVLAYVELEEGVKMMTNVVECDPESVRIGMPVEVVFEDVNEQVTIPLFKPLAQ